jgi:hypothetical protein
MAPGFVLAYYIEVTKIIAKKFTGCKHASKMRARWMIVHSLLSMKFINDHC